MSFQDDMTRRLVAAMLCAGLTLGLGGCRHRVKVATLPPVLVPVPLVEVPPPAKPAMVEVPHIKMPPMPIASAAAKFPRERRRPVAKVAAPPEPAAVVNPAPVTEAAIGSLTAGGTANPQTKQEASDLIASIERRLNALPGQKVEEQKAQISTVRNFQRQAQEALNSGDAEGAKTLAIKAKLLLDDLEK